MSERIPSQLEVIASLLRAGYSYAAIGREIGLSRERVRQVAQKTGYKQLVPTREVGILLGRTSKTIAGYLQAGKIKGFKAGRRWVITEIPEGIVELECLICGKMSTRVRYCGLHNRNEINRWRYRNIHGVKERTSRNQREYKLRRRWGYLRKTMEGEDCGRV